MLIPKRVKFRRHQRGRMKGYSKGGTDIHFGQFGLQALEPSWITSQQIEAARIAMTRYVKRGGRSGSKFFPTSLLLLNRLKHAWVRAKDLRNTGLR